MIGRIRGNFYVGLLVGALLASGVFLVRLQDHPRVSEAHRTGSKDDEPQWWLLPKDFSLARLYTEPDALFVLDAPDSITIHRAGAGSITIFEHTFATDGVSPTPDDAKTIVAAFQSPNAYTAPSACIFQPGVLVRLRRGEHRLDLLVCFKCDEMAWVLDGQPTLTSGAGLSDIGIGTLRSVFHRVFPNDPAFKAQ